MRLTLRTLLAYRDGVMSAKDAEDFHERVQSNEVAANLLKRIDTVSSQIQPATATLVGKGLVGDPNYMAEYLDDTLHGEKVPELERLFLESNAQLAELADCHQLLSSAMHTRVRVPQELHELAVSVGDPAKREELRQQLAERKRKNRGTTPLQPHLETPSNKAEGQLSQEAAATEEIVEDRSTDERIIQVHTPMVASGGESIKPQGLNLEGEPHEIPEYLLNASRGNWKIPLAILGLFLLLGFLVWQALGPWDKVVALFASKPAAPPAQPVPENTPSADTSDNEDTSGGAIEDADGANGNEASSDSASDSASDSEASPNAPSDSTNGPDSAQSIGFDPSAASSDAQPTVAAPMAAQPAEASQPAASETGSTGASDERDSPDTREEPAPQAPDAQPSSGAAWDSDEPATLLANMQGTWQPLQPGDIPLAAELLVPPSTSLNLQLPSGVIVDVRGASRFGLTPDGIATRLMRGIASSSSNGNTLQIATDLGKYSVVLNGPSAAVAIEMTYRKRKHGSLEDAGVMEAALLIVAVEGSATVSSDTEAVGLALGEGLAVVDRSVEKFNLRTIPRWYRDSAFRPIDTEAAFDLAKAMQSNPDPLEVLGKLEKSSRPEVAALAVQTSLLLGQWSSLRDSGIFDNSRSSSHWRPTIEFARLCASSSAAQLEALKSSYSSLGPEAGRQLQILLGSKAEDLSSETSRKASLTELVDTLEDDQLANRVLALYELRQLTGLKLGYLAQAPDTESVQRWRRELLRDRLKLRSLGDMIYERVAP